MRLYNFRRSILVQEISGSSGPLSQRKISRRNIPSGRPNQSLIWMYFRKDSLHRFSGIFGNIWEYFNLWNWYAAMFWTGGRAGRPSSDLWRNIEQTLALNEWEYDWNPSTTDQRNNFCKMCFRRWTPGHFSIRVDVHLVEDSFRPVLGTLLVPNNGCRLKMKR